MYVQGASFALNCIKFALNAGTKSAKENWCQTKKEVLMSNILIGLKHLN